MTTARRSQAKGAAALGLGLWELRALEALAEMEAARGERGAARQRLGGALRRARGSPEQLTQLLQPVRSRAPPPPVPIGRFVHGAPAKAPLSPWRPAPW